MMSSDNSKEILEESKDYYDHIQKVYDEEG